MMPAQVDVPRNDTDRTLIDILLPRIEAAVHGGPAVIPVPTTPAPLRDTLVAELRPGEPVDDDIALVVPTSGSTGTPRGVLLSQSALLAAAEATHLRLGGPGAWLLALPATHIAGLMVLVRSVVAGTRPHVVDLGDGFHPEAFAAATDALFATRPARAYTALVARQLGAIVKEDSRALAALARYDAVLVGGSAVSQRVRDAAAAAGVNVVATYGMTETCGGCVYDGTPLDGVRIDIDDSGLVRIAGPILASGYRLRPDLTDAAFHGGWFHTTDLGSIGADGLLTIHGRSDDVAISGGVNVPLIAVDLAVAAHPGVADAVAVAVPDETWGQRIVAAIVAADPGHPPALESVRAYVKGRAPAAYAPQEVVMIDSVPATPSGKADRRAVAELI